MPDRLKQGRTSSAKPMIAYILHIHPISTKCINPPYFSSIYVVLLNLRFLLPPILTTMHDALRPCIILYTYCMDAPGLKHVLGNRGNLSMCTRASYLEPPRWNLVGNR